MSSAYDGRICAICPASLLCYTNTLVHFVDCSMCGNVTGVLFGAPRPNEDPTPIGKVDVVKRAMHMCYLRYISLNDWTVTPNVGWKGTQMCPQCLSMYGSENRYFSW